MKRKRTPEKITQNKKPVKTQPKEESEEEDIQDASIESENDEMEQDENNGETREDENKGGPKEKIFRPYAAPTAEELKTYASTSALFSSNLLRLQITELLSELRVNYSSTDFLQTFLHRIHSTLESYTSAEYDLSTFSPDQTSKFDFFFQSLSLSTSLPPLKFKVKKPENFRMIGSYLLHTNSRPILNVDVGLEINSSFFKKEDAYNYNYFIKRFFFIYEMGKFLLAQNSKSKFIKKIQFQFFQNDETKPILEIVPAPVNGLSTRFKIRLYPILDGSAESLPAFKLPIKSLDLTHSFLKNTNPGMGELNGLPTPKYNQKILEDLVYFECLKYFNQILGDAPTLNDAILLLKYWNFQRLSPGNTGSFLGGFKHDDEKKKLEFLNRGNQFGAGGGEWNGFLMTCLVIGLLNQGKINKQMSSIQAMKMVLSYLSKEGALTSGGTEEVEEEEEEEENGQKNKSQKQNKLFVVNIDDRAEAQQVEQDARDKGWGGNEFGVKVLWRVSGKLFCNLAARVSKSTARELQIEATNTLKLLYIPGALNVTTSSKKLNARRTYKNKAEKPKSAGASAGGDFDVDNFEFVFMKNLSWKTKYDCYLVIKRPSQTISRRFFDISSSAPEDDSAEDRFSDEVRQVDGISVDCTFGDYLKQKLEDILTFALSDRVRNLAVWQVKRDESHPFPEEPEPQPQPTKKGKGKGRSSKGTPTPPVATPTKKVPGKVYYVVGIELHSTNWARIVDKGPQNEDSAAVDQWRYFWGEKSEVRRFKDGRILETVVWGDPQLMTFKPQKRYLGIPAPDISIVRSICEFVLRRHCEIPSSSIGFLGDQTDRLLKKYGDGVTEKSDWQYRLAKVKELEKLLRSEISIRDLPLRVINFYPVAPGFRGTSEFRNLSSSSRGSDRILDVLIQLENSSSWPDDLEAMGKLKCGFLIKIAHFLKRNAGKRTFNYSLNAVKQYMDIYEHGLSFRLRVIQPKELALLTREDIDNARELDVEHEFVETTISPEEKNKIKDRKIQKRHNFYLNGPKHAMKFLEYSQRFPEFQKLCRLIELWMNKNLLYGELLPGGQTQWIELTALYVWNLDTPLETSQAAGEEEGVAGAKRGKHAWKMFLRWMRLWAENWVSIGVDGTTKALFVHPDDKVWTPEEKSDVEKALNAAQAEKAVPGASPDNKAAMWVVTKEDPESAWTKDYPTIRGAQRIIAAAKESLPFLMGMWNVAFDLYGKPAGGTVRRPEFDSEQPLPISVKRAQADMLLLEDAFEVTQDYRYIINLNVEAIEEIHVVGLDVVHKYVCTLRKLYSGCCRFEFDGIERDRVFVWKHLQEQASDKTDTGNKKKGVEKFRWGKPKSTTDLEINWDQLVNEWQALGGNLVSAIEINK